MENGREDEKVQWGQENGTVERERIRSVGIKGTNSEVPTGWKTR